MDQDHRTNTTIAFFISNCSSEVCLWSFHVFSRDCSSSHHLSLLLWSQRNFFFFMSQQISLLLLCSKVVANLILLVSAAQCFTQLKKYGTMQCLRCSMYNAKWTLSKPLFWKNKQFLSFFAVPLLKVIDDWHLHESTLMKSSCQSEQIQAWLHDSLPKILQEKNNFLLGYFLPC